MDVKVRQFPACRTGNRPSGTVLIGDRSKYAEGPNNARVMLVDKTRKEEAKQHRPFVEDPDKYLDRVLRQRGIDREALYITFVVKEPTPGNRKPTAEEIRRWMPELVQAIKEVGPEIVVLMGKVAWNTPRFEDIRYIETYHPAAAMRFPKARRRFERDGYGDPPAQYAAHGSLPEKITTC